MIPRILVVEDEPDAVELIKFNLKAAGYEVVTAADGDEALKKAKSLLPNLIILDLMIPEVDGLEVCKILRRDVRASAIPIIMLTAKAGEVDRVLGLELGADDYVTKPFSPRELVLRVKRLLRGPAENLETDQITLNELRLDIPRHQALVKGKPIELTATEFRLLTVLAQRRGAGLGQIHRHAYRQQRRCHHKDDQQHQHHVHKRRDVDLGHDAATAAAAP